MSAHLDLDALADLLAGEGSDDDLTHVAECERCAAALTDLDAAQVPVAAALAAYAVVPVPPPPDDLEARLLAALRETAQEPAPEAVTGPAVLPVDDDRDEPVPHRGAPASVVPFAQRRPPRRSRPLLTAAAGAAGLLLLAGVGMGLTLGTTTPHGAGIESGAGGGGAADSALAAPALGSGRDYPRDPAGLRAAVGALLDRPSGSGEEVAGATAPPALERLAVPGTTTDPTAGAGPQVAAGTVPGPTDATTKATTEATTDASVRARVEDPLGRLRDPAQLQGCLDGLAAPAPLAVDWASLEGTPAVVLVLPAPEADAVDVTVVGPGCRPGAPDLLLRTRVAR